MSYERRIQVRVSEAMESRLKHQAKRLKVTVANLARDVILQELDRLEGKSEVRFEPKSIQSLITTLLTMEEILVMQYDPKLALAVKGDKARAIQDIYDRSEQVMKELLKRKAN